MGFLDLILGRTKFRLDEAEEELGKPDKAEAHDLPLHVSRCALRWALSYRQSKDNNAQLAQQRVFIILILVIEAARSTGAADWLKLAISAAIR